MRGISFELTKTSRQDGHALQRGFSTRMPATEVHWHTSSQ